MLKALGLVLGAALAGAAIGVVTSRRSRPLAGWREDLDDAWGASTSEQDAFERRARGAGAQGELTFVGAGAEGVTLCDERGRAFKIGRRRTTSSRKDSKPTLRDEAAWLAMAGKIASIKQHVPRDVRYDADNDVIVRECLTPRPGSRISGNRLWALHQRLTATMAPYGHGRPEYKDDSYVYTRRGPVLVDAGFAVNRGDKLVKEALNIANGRETASQTEVRDIAWALRMERGETIPETIANKILRRLQAIEPSVEL